MPSVPIEIQDDSIVIHAFVNGEPVQFVLDTGDAIGPTFTTADAERLGLVKGAPMGIEGAGGASSAWQTTASITFDDITWTGEPGAIDDDLEGSSLLGLPFFLAKCAELTFCFTTSELTMVPAQ
jgi:predicted aspartyl protease